jgi:hypothetical protein
MEAARVLKKGELIEQFTTTFGIEIEFCTHNSDYLSYTHIEVCQIKDGIHEWKIETDSDYTLELVSPILFFKNHQQANACKQYIVIELYKISIGSNNLGHCINQIQALISESCKTFNFQYWDLKNQEVEKPNNELTVAYISQEDLLKELSYHNWDDTTEIKDLESVKSEIQQKDLQKYLENEVKVELSKKHRGIPSSQLNLPMSLKAYVWYSAYVKEPAAWLRLVMLFSLGRTQQNLDAKKLVQHFWYDDKKILGSRLVKKRIERLNKNKTENWYKYWFWLVSIRELTEKALGENYKQPYQWRKTLDTIKEDVVASKNWEIILDTWLTDFSDEKTTPIIIKTGLPSDIKVAGNKLSDHHYWKESTPENGLISSLLYLTVEKLITGALGVLSEPAQLELQRLIVLGKIPSKQAKGQVKNSNFMDYHSFLKDLTPLWFKGTLADVLMIVLGNESIKREIVFEGLLQGISKLDDGVMLKVLERNFECLERLYGYTFQLLPNFKLLEWKQFKSSLLPDVDIFKSQYDIGRKALLEVLNTIIKSPENIETILKSFRYKDNLANKNLFLERLVEDALEGGKVPPWEGRWDTLKPPIVSKTGEVEFLVEHRNN